MPQVFLTRLAQADLNQAAKYIALQAASRRVAVLFLDAVDERASVYARHSQLGEPCPQFGPDLRQFIVRQYVFFYRPIDTGIEIVRILHGNRDVPNIMRTEPLD